jgi:polar amino acid transport system permease protein
MYTFDFTSIITQWPGLIRGTVVTLQLFFLASFLGTLVGCGVALIAIRESYLASLICFVLDVIKAVPVLVIIFFLYYLPTKELFGLPPLSPFTAVTGALLIGQMAGTADIVRVAILQTPNDQLVGLRGIGLSSMQIHRNLTLPWIIRCTFSSHMAMWIGNLKLSSLASIFGVPDVVYVAKINITQNFRSFEAWLVVAAIYVVLVLPLTYFQRWLERSPYFLCNRHTFS